LQEHRTFQQLEQQTILRLIMRQILALLLLATTATVNATQPNVVLIMADDMGYEALSVNGSESCKTPNLDKLAAGGIRFTNCFANPLCTPSRAKITEPKR
jgi:arylsulfatase A